MAGAAMLEVEGLSKHFGGLAAVDDLSFSVVEGETFGIAGPNGAGKTTLFDAITGLARASSGRIVFAGEEIQDRSSHAICQRGVARTFQIPAVFPEHTVLGNIALGDYFGRRSRRFFRGAEIPDGVFAASRGSRSTATRSSERAPPRRSWGSKTSWARSPGPCRCSTRSG